MNIRKIRHLCNVRKTDIVTIIVNIVLKHLFNGFLHGKEDYDYERAVEVLFTYLVKYIAREILRLSLSSMNY